MARLSINTAMNRVNRVEIAGFKGLESADLEFKEINVITGKNNTGKTSLLEAIDLSLNPSHVRNYPEPLEQLVNVDQRKAEIFCHVNDSVDEFIFRTTEQPEAMENYREFISNLFDISKDSKLSFRLRGTLANETENDISKILREEALQYLRSTPEEFQHRVSSNTYIVKYNGDEYPYLSLGGFHDWFLDSLSRERGEDIVRRIQNDTEFSNESDIDIQNILFHLLHGPSIRPGSGVFIRSPSGRDKSSYIRSGTLESIPDDDEEGASVIKTEIRDYLEEHGIVEGIEDFDFDEMVIEDDKGERIPISYEYQGDGFKSIVGILWRLLQQDAKANEVVLLEEPENHMHPGYIDELVPFLIDTASDDGRQLFITTHNVDFISAFISTELANNRAEYLKENLRVIQMGESYDQVLDFSRARKDFEELHDDLRGI